LYTDYANSEGWRDRERTIQRRPNTLRILVLGDSGTYGAIVGQVDTYTAILERKLRANGVDAEVINMSYGGWGTDQELEALTLEGVSYKPDLVILQFCTNDPFDVGYFASNDENTRRLKPFYYELDASGALQRHVNPLFKTDPPPVTLYDRARNLAKHIEILRTPIMLYRAYQMRASSGVTAPRADGVPSRPQYAIKAGRIVHVKLVSWNRSSFTKSRNRCQDLISSFSPDERLGIFVVSVDVLANSRFEFTGATKDAASNLFLREQPEPAFHQIDPGSSRRGEVQMEARSFEQPSMDRR
jgi:GDSL-like Lipase/Acylhydrolase family